MRITRRDLMRGAGSFVSAVLLGKGTEGRARQRSLLCARAIRNINLADAGPLSGTRLYEDVIAYYNLGEHRTATEADLRTSQWLIEQLRATGLKATAQSFGLRQFFIHQTRLTVGDRSIKAFPLWF